MNGLIIWAIIIVIVIWTAWSDIKKSNKGGQDVW